MNQQEPHQQHNRHYDSDEELNKMLIDAFFSSSSSSKQQAEESALLVNSGLYKIKQQAAHPPPSFVNKMKKAHSKSFNDGQVSTLPEIGMFYDSVPLLGYCDGCLSIEQQKSKKPIGLGWHSAKCDSDIRDHGIAISLYVKLLSTTTVLPTANNMFGVCAATGNVQTVFHDEQYKEDDTYTFASISFPRIVATDPSVTSIGNNSEITVTGMKAALGVSVNFISNKTGKVIRVDFRNKDLKDIANSKQKQEIVEDLVESFSHCFQRVK
jgi:hypothetical protein